MTISSDLSSISEFSAISDSSDVSDMINKAGQTAANSGHYMIIDIGCTKTTCLIAGRAPFEAASLKGRELAQYPANIDTNIDVDIDVIGAAHMARRVPCASGMTELCDQHILKSVIAQAEAMAKQNFTSLYVSVPGQHIVFRRYVIELALKGMPVDVAAMMTSLREGRRRAAAAGEIPLHIWPVSWSVDTITDLKDPRGVRGSTLRLEMTSASCSEHVLATFRDRLSGQYRRIAGFIAAPYASSLGIFLDEERMLGGLCLDIGSHYTNYVTMIDDDVVSIGTIPVGGDLITKDIARAFSISLSVAEKLKRRHATACLSPGEVGKCYEVPQIDCEDTLKAVHASHLQQVVEARLQEIADLVKADCIAQGINLSPVRRLVLAGGGCQIDGSDRALGQYLGMTARIAHPLGVRDAPDLISGPAFATGYGMARYVAVPPLNDIAPKGLIDRVFCHLFLDRRTENTDFQARGLKHRTRRRIVDKLSQTADTLFDRSGFGGVSNWLRAHF